MEVGCPGCGAALAPGLNFCTSCGTPVAEDPPAAPSAGSPTTTAASPHEPRTIVIPEAGSTPEVRLVSVLFVDLVGYTSLSEGRDPEDVREVLSRYFDIARTVIDRYGGEVAKFIGDAVMAVWGTPVAREDDAERAVRAGLDLVAAVQAFGTDNGLPELQLRGGIVTGQAAAMSVEEGIVVGDRVNTAARIQSLATPGTVYVDDATKEATSAAIAYVDGGTHEVKGKAEPVRVWHATRVVAGLGGSQRVDGLEAHHVGRSAQLDLVKTLFHATVDDGRARLVAVSGLAGVGKSRLVWEFEKYLDGLTQSAFWHTGRCLSYGDGIAYWALAEMVRGRIGAGEDDPAPVVTERLDEALARFVPDDREREFVHPRLAQLLGLGGTQNAARDDLFSGWRLFFQRLADQHGVVMVFEDLQWADDGLLDFIEHLLDWAADSRIFIVALTRPELLDRRRDWSSAHRNASTVHLDALSDAGVDELLDDLVPGLPEALRARIRERAEGIPLYAIETIRMLIDRDVVVPQGGVYRLVDDPGELDVPATLASLIAARLDGLDPAERALVTDLSVLGDSFPRSSIAAVADLPDEELSRLLADLVRKEILSVRVDPLAADRGHYAFLQSLVRKIAYETLSKHERKARHLRVANHLREASDDADEIAELVAAHYDDAYRAVPDDPDADELRLRAARAFERAGTRAASLGAQETALRAFERAIHLAPDDDMEARLHEAAATAASAIGRYGKAITHLEAAIAIHDRHDRTREAARLTGDLGRQMSREGRRDEAMQRMAAALEVLSDPPDEYLPNLAAAFGVHEAFAGRVDEAGRLTDLALAVAQSFDDERAFTLALGARAMAMVVADRYDEAEIDFRSAIARAVRLDLFEAAGIYYNNLADLLNGADDASARDVCDEGIDLARRAGLGSGLASLISNRALIDLFRGDWDSIERANEEISLDRYDRTDFDVTTRVVTVRALRGDTAGAERLLRRLDPWRDHEDLQNRGGYLTAHGTVHLAAGDHERAVTMCGAAIDVSLELGLRTELFRQSWPDALEAALGVADVAAARRLLTLLDDRPVGHVPPYLRAQRIRFGALLDAATGSFDQVDARLRDAEERFRTLGYPFWIARTLLDRATWWRGASGSVVAAVLEEATSIFVELRAEPWLELCRALRPTDLART